MVEAIGWTALGLAALVGAINFFASLLRYPLYRLLRREYHWESGLPMIGSVCLLVALACLWRTPLAWIIAAVIAAIDTAGLPWFVGVMLLASLRKPR